MALSREWTDWHLTPRGWEAGEYRADNGHRDSYNPEPPDRVQSYRYHEELASGFSEWHRWHELLWESDDKQAITTLQEKFGPPPQKT